MNSALKNNLLKWNSILWLAAMVLPGIFSITFASTKFPWQITIPLLLFGPMLASNRMIARALEEPADPPAPNEPNA